MGMIPDDVKRDIRERADIVAVIGQHVALRKAGRNHKGLCPFHNEKTPSFNVNSEKGFFYCFGCQKKGDVFTFVMEYEGKSFPEALESLAALVGVDIPEQRQSPAELRQRSQRSRMLEINALACEFFRAALNDPRRGQPGREYLAARGIKPEIAEAFQLGYAPEAWHQLADYLADKRVPAELACEVGLVVRQPNAGGVYDRFRHRLMCPVVLPGGEIAGFSGRILPPAPGPGDGDGDRKARQAAKYINSPESPVYKKSRLLFGIDRARDAFRRSHRAILVEGNFDVINLHQAGFDNAVAPLGTALTSEQVGQLRRLVDEVVLLYDGDKAGRAAAFKALEAMVEADVKVRIAALPIGEDPDGMIASGRADALAQLLERAQPGIEYFIHEVWSRSGQSADDRAEALAHAAELLAHVANPTKRDLITGTLASAMDVDPKLIRRATARSARPSKGRGQRPSRPPQGRGQRPSPPAHGRGPQRPGQRTGSRAPQARRPPPGAPPHPAGGPQAPPHPGHFDDGPPPVGFHEAPHPADVDDGWRPPPTELPTGGVNGSDGAAPEFEAEPHRPPPPPPREELEIIALIAEYPQLMEHAEAENVVSLLTDARLRDMYCAARQGESLLSVASDDIEPLLAKHVLMGSYAAVADPAHSLVEATRRLAHMRNRIRLGELQRQAEDARRRGDKERARQLVHEIVKTRRQVD